MNKLFELVPVTRENIKAGLILRSPASDGSVHVFNDTVIQSIDEKNIVHLVRPYCFIKNGVVTSNVEKVSIPVEFLVRDKRHFLVMEGSRPAQVWE